MGLVLTSVFNRSLDGKLNILNLPAAARERIDAQRPKLAAMETSDPRVREAVAESFTAGYRTVIWIAAALGILSSLTAAALIDDKRGAK